MEALVHLTYEKTGAGVVGQRSSPGDFTVGHTLR